MNERPPTFAEARLLRRRRPNPIVVALKGAVFLGGTFTLFGGLLIAAANDTSPDFLSAALICVPAGALLTLAGVWLVERILRAQAARDTARRTDATNATSTGRTEPPPLPNREPDSE